jgi:sialidase-1
MARIEYVEGCVLYENPRPSLHSRHGYFPGLVHLSSGDLLALFMIAEAFEAPNGTTWISRSRDCGRTWHLEGPLYDKSVVGCETTDTFKPAVLRDGSLIATGYRFHRSDPEQGIGIQETGGILPGDNIVAFSQDQGKTWTVPKVIPRSRPELLEISGPCVELRSGHLVAVAALFPMPDGTHPSGRLGVLLRSSDDGKSWDDRCVFYRSANGKIVSYEPRVCEMQDGRLVALVWAYEPDAGVHHPNQVIVSHDNGHTWSTPIDTGHMGQASNLLSLGGDLLATIHAHRGSDPGVYVRIVDFRDDQWHPLEEAVLYGKNSRHQTRTGQTAVEMFTSLRFGQPSLLRLSEDEFLAYHWVIEDGQGKIRLHRLRLMS